MNLEKNLKHLEKKGYLIFDNVFTKKKNKRNKEKIRKNFSKKS